MRSNRELLAADLCDELEKISVIEVKLQKHAPMLERAATFHVVTSRNVCGNCLNRLLSLRSSH